MLLFSVNGWVSLPCDVHINRKSNPDDVTLHLTTDVVKPKTGIIGTLGRINPNTSRKPRGGELVYNQRVAVIVSGKQLKRKVYIIL